MVFSHPYLLWLLPLALIPLAFQRSHTRTYSWLSMLPKDPLSDLVGLILKILAVCILTLMILGLSAPHTKEQKIEKIGVGAQIALVLDRSASMDDPFAGTKKSVVGESKSAAAARLITEFVQSRKNDMIGMITFSNSAMYVLPLTENKKAVTAAVQATAGNALFQTNIGGGLTASAGLFKNIPNSGSRAVILLSDGAGRIGEDVQEKIKDWFDQMELSLYWIILRKPGGLSIFNEDYKPAEGQPMPAEFELNDFFKTLKTPFHAYEADNSKALELAIEDINRKERKPIKYFEKIPGKAYANVCFTIAAILIGLLLGIKYLEVNTWK